MRWKGQIEMSDVKVHGWAQINNDFELMMICALRYAIGRGTDVPDTAISYIRYLIPQLSAKTLYVMKRDIEEEVKTRQRLNRELHMAKEWAKLAEEIGDMYEKKEFLVKAVQE